MLTVGKNWAGTRSPTKHETPKPRGINRTEPEQTQTRGERGDGGGMLTRRNNTRLGFGQRHFFDLNRFLLVGCFSCNRLVRYAVISVFEIFPRGLTELDLLLSTIRIAETACCFALSSRSLTQDVARQVVVRLNLPISALYSCYSSMVFTVRILFT